MIFASRIAKLGKAVNINCNQISATPVVFNVYLGNKNVSIKTLTHKDSTYQLSKQTDSYNYTEMLGVTTNFVVARNGNCFSLLKVQDGS